jgi:hypothetical protein
MKPKMVDTLTLLNDIEETTVIIVRDKLKQLQKRKRNWDHQGGIPASKEIMLNAVAFLDMVIAQYKPLPTRIWMTPLGEITFVFPDEIWVRIEEDDVIAWFDKVKQTEVFDKETVPTVFESL